MNRFDKSNKISLHDLAQQVRQGDRQAAERFLERMRPQMERMVRQTVRRHVGPDCYGTLTTQGRLILAEYHRFCQSAVELDLSSDEIVARVAHRLCENMVGQLQSERPGMPSMAVYQGALETVCG
jgi:hypothetical protein